MNLPTKQNQQTVGDIMEAVILKGDLASLTPMERVSYYNEVCRSIGVNPLTRPLEFIRLSGKETLYAKRDCADQLRKINGISISIVSAKDTPDGMFVVHAKATDKNGREDEDYGVVALPETVKGEARANAILKAITKAKRRVTLSISGLGFLDETEVDDVKAATIRRPLAGPNPMLSSTNQYADQVEHMIETTNGNGGSKEIETVTASDDTRDGGVAEKVALCGSVKALGNYFRTLTAAEQEQFRDIFSARRAELEA